jgi:hypothetical protein
VAQKYSHLFKFVHCIFWLFDLLQAAVSSFAHAASRWQHQHAQDQPLGGTHQSQCPLAAGLALELGQALRVDLDRIAEAATQYRHAADLQQNSPLEQLNSLGLLATCKIELGQNH